MRRFSNAVLACGLALTLAPSAHAQAPTTGAINGTAQSSAGQTLPNFTVRLRNLQTGQLAGSTTSNAAGTFSFSALNPADYVIEIVNESGVIVGTSSAVSVAAGATVSLTVTASAVAAITSGAAAAAAGAGAGAGAGLGTTAIVITTVAAAGGIAGVVAVAKDPSPTK